jgi:hypothetical protein
MTEDYLHYIWKFGKFDMSNLATTEGESVRINKVGYHNFNAGPDFLESNITIGNEQWIGSTEIHISTSDWDAHKHQFDPGYDNVVLHVVYENNKEIKNSKGDLIPTLELKQIIDHNAYFYYEQFIASGKSIPCANKFVDVPDFIKVSSFSNALYERLETKSQKIEDLLASKKGSWEEVFHTLLFRHFGMKVNSDALENLATKTPLSIVQKCGNDIFTLEALLFGQAGMLIREQKDEYHQKMRSEYLFLKQKWQLTNMLEVEWKFARLRPPNFPTLRIAQLAGIYSSTNQLFQVIRDELSLKDIQLVLDTSVSDYWTRHFVFGKESKVSKKDKLGKDILNNIIINVIVPIAFCYGRNVGDEKYVDYAIKTLESCKAENNKITRVFNELNYQLESAFDSQAAIQLYSNFCLKKNCLNCKIGVHLLNQ